MMTSPVAKESLPAGKPETPVTFLRCKVSEKPLTVVFLHHFGGSSKTWSEVVERLAQSEPSIRCLVPDLHGFGVPTFQGSSRGYDIDDYGDDVAELILARGIERYLLVGHSMGGKIALALASRQPPRLAGLLLVAPSPPTPEPMSNQDREQLRKAREDAAIASEIVSLATASRLSASVHARTVADVLGSSPEAWSAWLESGSRKDISAQMTLVDVPVTVLAAARDAGLTPSLLRREVIDRITGSRLVVIPDSAHLMPLDAPAAISWYVRRLVRSLDDARPALPPDAPRLQMRRTEYPPEVVRHLLMTDLVTEPTRRVLNARLNTPPVEQATFFDDHAFRTLRAVCARLVPQPMDNDMVDIAGTIDLRLASQEGNGWRYDVLPPDGEAYRIGLQGMNEVAAAAFRLSFCDLYSAQQDEVLSAVQQERIGGGSWDLLSPSHFFEELLAEVSEIYFSSPIAQERIGYVGMADNRGWQAISLNQLTPHEPRPLEASNA